MPRIQIPTRIPASIGGHLPNVRIQAVNRQVNDSHWLVWWDEDHLEPRREACYCHIGEAHNKHGELVTAQEAEWTEWT